MLNKRLIVALLAVVILFLGIFSFAQSGSDEDPDKNSGTKEENKTKDEDKDDDKPVVEEEDDEGTDLTVPPRNNVTPVAADTTDPVIILNGDEEITIDLNQNYVDAGATATDNVTANVTVVSSSNININVAGVYQVIYTASDAANNTASITRTVKVRPLIIQPENYSHEVNTLLDDSKVLATIVLGPETTTSLGPNNLDIVATNVLGEYVLEYAYQYTTEFGSVDAIGKQMTLSIVDTTKPVVSINKNESDDSDLIFEVDKTKPNQYVELGAILTDNYNSDTPIIDLIIEKKDIENNWIRVESIDTSIVSEYRVRYNGKDSSDNEAVEAIRSVRVVDTTKPKITGFSVNWNPEIVEADKNATYIDTAEVYTSDNSSDPITVTRVGCNVNMAVPGKYKCGYKTTDAAGNIAWNDRFISVVDTTKPTIISVTPSTTDMTKDDITLTVDTTDNTEVTAYSFDNGLNWQSSNNRAFSDNQDVSIVIKDGSGNVSDATTVSITNIDKVVPEIVSITQLYETKQDGRIKTTFVFNEPIKKPGSDWQTVNSTTYVYYYYRTKTVNLTFEDLVGNKNTVTFDVDKTVPTASISYGPSTLTNGNVIAILQASEDIKDIIGWTKVSSTVFQKEYIDNQTETINFEDLIGNPGSSNISVNNIDRTSPTIEMRDISGQNGALYVNDGKRIAISFKLNEEVSSLSATIAGINAAVAREGNGIYRAVVTVNATSPEGRVSYTISATDIASNPSTIINDEVNGKYVTIDRTSPTLETTNISGQEASLFVNEGKRIVVNFRTNEELSNVTATIAGAAASIAEESNGYYRAVSYVNGASPEGKANYTISGTDRAGNVTTLTSNKVGDKFVTIDKTLPLINNVTGNSDVWTKQDVTLTVNATDANGIYKYSFDNGATWQSENIKVFTTNQDVTILVKDLAGNISVSEVTHITKIDKTAPTLKVEDPNQSFAPAKSFSRLVTVSDSLSGLDESSMKYLWSTSRDASMPLVSTQGTSFASGDRITTPAGVTGKYYLLIEVKDNASNKKIYMSWAFEIDNTVPEATVLGNPEDWTNQDVTLTVNATDNSNKFDENAYSFDNGITWQSDNTKVFTTNQDVTVLVKDKAGNVSLPNVISITKIDKAAPKVKIEDPNQNSAYAKSVSRKITASDSLSGLNGSTMKYLWSTSRDASMPLVSTQGTLFNAGDTITSPVGATGKYYLLVEVKDNAGNKSTAMSWAFYIDDAAPVINSVTSNPSVLTIEDVFLTVNATDTGVGLASLPYSFDDGITWQASNTMGFDKNQIVNIKVKDSLDNISSTSVEISNIVIVSSTFDTPLTLSNTQTPGAWYKDRYVPADFGIFNFNGQNVLKQSINASDAQTNNFYNYQGRKYDTDDATQVSIDLYVPNEWAFTNRNMAGLWGTGFTGNTVVSYPILNFTNEGGSRFRVYDFINGGYIDIGLPSNFTYDRWYTLTIKLDTINDQFIYKVGDLTYVGTANGTTRIGNAILEGLNTSLGVTYDIYWDNFIAKKW